MDYILKGLSKDIGIKYGGKTINALAYADDVVLMASSRQGLSYLLDKFVVRAASLGLNLGVRKCTTSGLRWLGKQKKIVADTAPFSIGQEELPTMNWDSVCKYLGVSFSLGGTTKWAGAQMREALRQVTSACLKPQQKLMLVRSYLFRSIITRFNIKSSQLVSLSRLTKL